MTMLPSVMTAAMHEQIVQARLLHEEDLACGWGETWFAGRDRAKDPLRRVRLALALGLSGDEAMEGPGGKEGRHHLHETVVQRAVTDAAKAAGIGKRVTCHTFRGEVLAGFEPSGRIKRSDFYGYETSIMPRNGVIIDGLGVPLRALCASNRFGVRDRQTV